VSNNPESDRANKAKKTNSKLPT